MSDILAVGHLLAKYEPYSNTGFSIPLTNDFEASVSKYPNNNGWFIKFYSPDCSYCK